MQKVIVSTKTGKSHSIEIDDVKMKSFTGVDIGKTLDAGVIGLTGYQIEITGGSDKDGFPMRRDIHGTVRPRILLRGGTGFNPKRKGIKRRKRVRGKRITKDIVQINARVVKDGKKPIEELLGKTKSTKSTKKPGAD